MVVGLVPWVCVSPCRMTLEHLTSVVACMCWSIVRLMDSAMFLVLQAAHLFWNYSMSHGIISVFLYEAGPTLSLAKTGMHAVEWEINLLSRPTLGIWLERSHVETVQYVCLMFFLLNAVDIIQVHSAAVPVLTSVQTWRRANLRSHCYAHNEKWQPYWKVSAVQLGHQYMHDMMSYLLRYLKPCLIVEVLAW